MVSVGRAPLKDVQILLRLSHLQVLFFFPLLLSSLELSDTTIYEP